MSFDLSTQDWLLLIVSALLIGLSKTAIFNLGMLFVPLLAAVLPARESVGVAVPLLMFGDVFAVIYYRRFTIWSHVFRLIPWALPGVALGYLALGRLENRQVEPAIGLMILIMIGIHFRLVYRNSREDAVPHHRAFAGFMGASAGFTSMMANASGPVMTIFLLAKRLPKREFVGTGAGFFLVVNWIKVLPHSQLGLVNEASLRLNLVLAPAVAVGAIGGIYLLKWIPQRLFDALVLAMAAAAALHLLWPWGA